MQGHSQTRKSRWNVVPWQKDTRHYNQLQHKTKTALRQRMRISPLKDITQSRSVWDQTYKGIQNAKIKGSQPGETLRPEGQNPQKSRIWNVTPHSKPHKWIAHFLHVFTKYQWVNTAQGVTDRELQSINCCCSSSRGRLSPQKQVELFGIFNPDEDHEPACDKKG